MQFKFLLVFFLTVLASIFSFDSFSHLPKSFAQESCTETPSSTNSATMTMTVSQTNDYTVWTRLRAPNSTNNSIWLQIDGGCAINIGDSAQIPAGQFTWVNYKDSISTSLITTNLTAGDHTIKLTQREGGVGVDRLLVTSDHTCIPSVIGENCPAPTSTTVTVTPVTPTPTMAATPITAGYQTWNGNFDSGNNNMISATQITTGASGGILQSISIYLGAAAAPSNHIQVGIYADNGSNNPSTLLGSSTTQVITPNSWNTIPLSPVTISPNTKYFLAFNLDGGTTQFGWNSTSTGISRWKSGITFGTWPSSYGTPTFAYNQQYAIYMTYNGSGSIPTTTPINTPIPTNTPVPTLNMTVSDMAMSYTTSNNNRTIKTVVTVINEQTLARVQGATVKLSLKSPTGAISTFSGSTTSNGTVTFTKQTKTRGTWTATVTNVTKAGYTYHPTNTVKTLLVY